MSSVEANEQLRSLVPEKAERRAEDQFFPGPLTYNSMGYLPSKADWLNRRRTYTEKLGLNFATRKIPLLLETLEDEISKTCQDGTRADLSEIM